MQGPPPRRPLPAPTRPWPLRWVLYAILGYIALQILYMLFVAEPPPANPPPPPVAP